MGIIVRQSFWNSIWSYLGIALGYVNLVLLFPKFLSTDEFGLTRIFIAASMVVAQFGSLGIVNISIKYFPFFKDNNNKHHNGFLHIGFLLCSIGAIISVLGLIVFKPIIIDLYIERSVLFINYYYWLFPISISLIYFNQFSAYARVIFKSSLQAFTKDFLIRILHFICIIMYALGFIGFELFLTFFILSYFANIFFLIVYLSFVEGINMRPAWSFYQKLPLGEISSYGFFVVLSSMGSIISGIIDMLMLGALSDNGLTDVAIYSVAFYIGNVVSVPIKAVNNISLPILANAWKKKDMQQIKSVYTKSSLNQLLIGCLLVLGIWSNIDNMFELLPIEYSSGKTVVLIIAFSQLFNLLTGVNSGVIVNSPYYRYDTLSLAVMVILNILLNYFFIKLYGFIGAAIATAITLVVFNIFRVLLVQVKSKMQPFSIQTIYVLIISAAIYGIQMLLPKLDIMLLDLIVRSALIVLLFVPAVYFFNISEEINRIIRKSLKTVSKLIGKE